MKRVLTQGDEALWSGGHMPNRNSASRRGRYGERRYSCSSCFHKDLGDGGMRMHGLGEVIDRAFQFQHQSCFRDHIRGIFGNDLNSQNLFIFGFKEQTDKALGSSFRERFAIGSERKFLALIILSGGFQFTFRLPHLSYFGFAVDVYGDLRVAVSTLFSLEMIHHCKSLC